MWRGDEDKEGVRGEPMEATALSGHRKKVSALWKHPRYRIRYNLPGRIRFYLPDLKGPANGLVSHYEQRYRKLEGVSAVRGSHITGTLLIVYDPSRVKLAKILYVLYQVNDYKESPLQTQTSRASHDKSPHDSSLRRQFAGILATGTILGVLVFQRFLTRWFSFMGGASCKDHFFCDCPSGRYPCLPGGVGRYDGAQAPEP